MQANCQIYVKGSIEAVKLYREAFNLTDGMTALNTDGTYEHILIMSINSQRKRLITRTRF